MQSFPAALRRVGGRLAGLLIVLALARRVRDAWRRRGRVAGRQRRNAREVLPSLYDRYPGAGSAPRRRVGLQSVDLDRIVGTVRHPSQNTGDFLPLPHLRGQNWLGRWQRISRAMERLERLPPIDLVQVGDDYYVTDGHNRIAAARRAGGLEIDADVTQLLLPGVTQPGQATLDASSLIGAAEVRQAGEGRQSRTVEQRSASDEYSRRDLLGDTQDDG
jgi:hypothetical protein